MDWYIDLYDAANTKIGPGPILSAQRWESTARMDRAGVFSFEMAAADAMAALVTPLTLVRCFALVGVVWTEIGAGVVETIAQTINEAGDATLTVSGPDMMAELAQRTMGPRYIDGTTTLSSEPMTPVTHAAAVAALVTRMTPASGWSMTPDAAPAVNSLVGRWNYESVLQAAIRLAEKCRTHFYRSGFRTLTFTSAFADSGIRAIEPTETMGAETAAIASVRHVQDAAEVVTTLIPFGAGNADARLTMLPKTTATPAGYSSPTGIWYRPLVSTAGLAAYGNREKVVVWNDITPISSTDGDVQAAANALFEVALRYLQQHEAPHEFYDLRLTQCPTLLRPMQSLRVVWRDPTQNIAIDRTLNILEATTTLDASGLRTTGLIVATVDRWPESDSGAVVDRLAQGNVYQAAPQLNANSYVISYTKPVDDVETATFRFRFDSEVVQLTRCTFDFQILPLESTVKSLAGTASTTSSGGSSTPTTSSGGSSTPTTSSGGGTTQSSTSASTHTHTVTIGDHTHSVSISNHTHTTPNHTHSFRIGGGSAPTYPIGFSAAGTSGGLVHNASGSDFNYPTNSGEGGTTSSSGGSSTPTTSSGGGTTPTSSSGGSHAHDVTIPNHSHTVTISAHSHDVTISAHTHDYTPTITASYGIFRDTAGNTFGLTDLEYSVDGSTWYAFTVGVNGFASLGDGWYRVDLTALLQNSSTLRPTTNNNAVRVRRKAAGATKKAMIEAQLNVRTIIQAIAAL